MYFHDTGNYSIAISIYLKTSSLISLTMNRHVIMIMIMIMMMMMMMMIMIMITYSVLYYINNSLESFSSEHVLIL